MQTISLKSMAATRETVRPFGMLIDASETSETLPVAFYEGSVKVFSPGNFRSDEDTELTLARIDRRPLQVRWLERHFKHTQAFIPLSGKPFLMVMAPATHGDLPIIDQARALLFDGTAGFALHLGIWHEFPFAIVDDTRVVVVLRREATRALMKDVANDGEAQSGDLDKKDIQKRLNVMLTVES